MEFPKFYKNFLKELFFWIVIILNALKIRCIASAGAFNSPVESGSRSAGGPIASI